MKAVKEAVICLLTGLHPIYLKIEM